MSQAATTQSPGCGAEAPLSHADYLALLMRAQRSGKGVLPFFLGLQPLQMLFLLQRYSGAASEAVDSSGKDHDATRERGALRQQLLEMRRDEWDDIRNLLNQHRAANHPLEAAMADIVAAGCLGGDHLWRDLGLTDRRQLGDLLRLFFPGLSAKNSKDMKWKKFFYKQLCEQEGGYVCRSPSCEECAVYDDCFGEEL